MTASSSRSTPPADARAVAGRAAEDLAARFLDGQGLHVVARNFRTKRGEIDLVARDGATLVFVEVKAREDLRFGGGAEAITALKRRRMARVALDYMARHQVVDCPCRFDVVSIHFEAGEPVFELFQNAFDVT